MVLSSLASPSVLWRDRLSRAGCLHLWCSANDLTILASAVGIGPAQLYLWGSGKDSRYMAMQGGYTHGETATLSCNKHDGSLMAALIAFSFFVFVHRRRRRLPVVGIPTLTLFLCLSRDSWIL